jgi:hypothetical protein
MRNVVGYILTGEARKKHFLRITEDIYTFGSFQRNSLILIRIFVMNIPPAPVPLEVVIVGYVRVPSFVI